MVPRFARLARYRGKTAPAAKASIQSPTMASRKQPAAKTLRRRAAFSKPCLQPGGPAVFLRGLCFFFGSLFFCAFFGGG